MRRRALLLAGGAVVLVQAILLTAVFTPAPHPGGDNAGYLALAHALASGEGYVELWDPDVPPHTKYPPAFPLLLAGLVLSGAASWATFKGLSALLVSLAGVLVFAWAAERRGPLVGAGVALLAVVSSGWLEASRWILSEPPFLAFTFLALWAADRVHRGGGRGWVLAACAAALLALLTRSAGLPVVLAVAGGLVLAGRARAAGGFAAVAGLAAGAWALRARGGGEGAYQSEFWMVNPYDPSLGTIGVVDLPLRAWANLRIYAGSVIPGEWWPGPDGLLAALGVAFVGAALAGWVLRLRAKDVGAAELFLPLYAGLILIWPEVWSGDRFVLPLHPLLLLYGGEAAMRAVGGRGWASGPASLRTQATGAVLFLVFALPAAAGWMAKAEEAGACRRIANGDVFRCLGSGMQEFRDAAAWAGANLPGDAVVLNRKPRIFAALGGTRGRTFPFSRDADVLLAEADRLGARYLLADRVDGVSMAYLPSVVGGQPGAFCEIRGWGNGTVLLGIRPAGERDGPDVVACPPGWAPDPARTPPVEGERVPLLLRRER